MENDLSPQRSPRIMPREDIIEAEWVEVETPLPVTDPAIVYLTPRPYSPDPEGRIGTQIPPKKTLLERLMTPWGIAGFLCLLTGNILLSWAQVTSRPESVAQTHAMPTNADRSSAKLDSATSSPHQNGLDRQSLDTSQLSKIKVTVPDTQFVRAMPTYTVGVPSAGAPLATVVLPASAPLPIAPSPVGQSAIAKPPALASVPKRPKPSLPVIPITLQPLPLPAVPPPPSPSTTPPAPPAIAPSAPPPINSLTLTEQLPPPSFNQKTRQQLLNLANQLPNSTENPGIVNQLQQEIQNNQGN